MKNFIIIKKLIVVPLFLCLFFTACEEEDDDYSISEITIYNIPAQVNKTGDDYVTNTYKVYLSASNSKEAEVLPVAKGVAKITGDNLEKNGRYQGTYTVKIKLQKPNPKNEMDPTLDTGPWSGTASFFLIVLIPRNVSGGKDMIWAKTGFTLDIGKEKCNWEDNKIFIDFRNDALYEAMNLDAQKDALFYGIVLKDGDPDIIKGPYP